MEFFIEFLTDEEDLVVDPFAGSDVTGAVCEKLSRRWLSVEIKESYVEGSILRFGDADRDPARDRYRRVQCAAECRAPALQNAVQSAHAGGVGLAFTPRVRPRTRNR